jgi:hypothetical protein
VVTLGGLTLAREYSSIFDSRDILYDNTQLAHVELATDRVLRPFL